MEKLLIIANWKCNPTTLEEAKSLFDSVKSGIKNFERVEMVICPPFVYLATRDKQQATGIKLGGQDCFWEEKGAFTGEISPSMLKNLGCQYVIIGHSERRKLGETDEMINKKIKAAIKAELKPILCIDETEKERKEGRTFKILKNQLERVLKGILDSKFYILNSIVIAYEPIWAIDSGTPCPPSQAKEVLLFLQKSPFLKEIPILYGGSVNSENAVSFIKKAGFQGLLVGSASLNPEEFIKIIENVSKI